MTPERKEGLESAVRECKSWLQRRKQTLTEIYGTDQIDEAVTLYQSDRLIEQAKAYGELYAYEALARAIQSLTNPR